MSRCRWADFIWISRVINPIFIILAQEIKKMTDRTNLRMVHYHWNFFCTTSRNFWITPSWSLAAVVLTSFGKSPLRSASDIYITLTNLGSTYLTSKPALMAVPLTHLPSLG